MKLHELIHPTSNDDIKLNEMQAQFKKLLFELEKRELPDDIVAILNNDVDEINANTSSGKELRKLMNQKLQKIIKLLEKECKLVPKGYYRNMWMALGMAVFGIPLGAAFGTSLGNMAYLGIGLPLGLAIGIAFGDGMDKKALKEGRQLDIEIK